MFNIKPINATFWLKSFRYILNIKYNVIPCIIACAIRIKTVDPSMPNNFTNGVKKNTIPGIINTVDLLTSLYVNFPVSIKVCALLRYFTSSLLNSENEPKSRLSP
jgi:hypothetical protein